VDGPVVFGGCFFERAGGCKALVEPLLETFDLVDVVWEVVARAALG